MFWFSELLKEEFIDYFRDDKIVYFTVADNVKIYHETFKKFSDTIDKLNLLLIANDADDEHYNKYKESEPDLYELSGGFFKEKHNLISLGKIGEIYRSIGDNVFECDIASLNADQLAVGIMLPFASRMGGSFEDRFAESGRLREFLLALYDKIYDKADLG